MNTVHMSKAWVHQRGVALDIHQQAEALLALFEAVRMAGELAPDALNRLIARHVRVGDQPVSRGRVIEAYRQLVAEGLISFDHGVFDRLRLKPVRTASGVAPVAVLTGPAACPGQCVFCPEVEGLPKSYLPDEPGARRAIMADFDPYLQTSRRIQALGSIGHATDKVELLILGGTWSVYPHDYQEHFIQRCLDAMNDQSSSSLVQAQLLNETAPHRNVGLVIETRPDAITLTEVQRLRWLGVTKVQLGVQSLDDVILTANRRGHSLADTRRACRLLRLAGFKLHLHWMPNLLGATPAGDREDFARLWADPALRPDELKIYPCSLLEGTQLYTLWRQGYYRPYTEAELVDLLATCKASIPPYCRVNRVMRDIPSDYIQAGVKLSHLRQVVQQSMQQQGLICRCIRCREVRQEKVQPERLRLEMTAYATDASMEHFLSYATPAGKLAGFLRLSLPQPQAARDDSLAELRGCAMIREVHVYGPALEIGAASDGQAQHAGLGTQLIELAAAVARRAGFARLAVISAIGTRPYYRRLGFELGDLYMTRAL